MNLCSENSWNTQRVVVTQCGVFVPGADSCAAFSQCTASGRSEIRALPWAHEFALHAQVAGQIDDDLLRSALATRGLAGRARNRQHQIALAVAYEALQNAPQQPIPLMYASAIGGFSGIEWDYTRSATHIHSEDFYFDRVAQVLQAALPIGATDAVGISTGCTSALDALGYALWHIRAGAYDHALVVAAEASLSPTTAAAFDVLGATTRAYNDAPHTASRPFDAARSGFVLGEGAAALMVESLASAQQRGATILAELLGFGSINSGYHMTDIADDGEAIFASMTAATEDLPPEAAHTIRARTNYINAHGSGTVQNDLAEARAFHRFFGPPAAHIPVNSTKSIVGHSLGAANLVEIVHIILQMQANRVDGNCTLATPDPALHLCLPVRTMHEYPIDTVLKTSSGFSGIHSALWLRNRTTMEVI